MEKIIDIDRQKLFQLSKQDLIEIIYKQQESSKKIYSFISKLFEQIQKQLSSLESNILQVNKCFYHFTDDKLGKQTYMQKLSGLDQKIKNIRKTLQQKQNKFKYCMPNQTHCIRQDLISEYLESTLNLSKNNFHTSTDVQEYKRSSIESTLNVNQEQSCFWDNIDDQAKNNVQSERFAVQNAFQKYPNRCTGKIIAYFYLTNLDGLTNMEVRTKIKQNQGSGFLIGKNLLVTPAHTVYRRQQSLQAKYIQFYPQVDNNNSNVYRVNIKSKKIFIFPEYANPKNEIYNQYDIALILLEDNQILKPQNVINIKWGYKRWQHQNEEITLLGYNSKINPYPINLRNTEQFSQTKLSICQREGICYQHQTWNGNSGALLYVKQETEEGYSAIGFHKCQKHNTKVGLTFETTQNIKQITLQLIQRISEEGGIKEENLLKDYEPSYKKLKVQYKNKLLSAEQRLSVLEKQLKDSNIIIQQRQKTISAKQSLVQQLKIQISLMKKNIYEKDLKMRPSNITIPYVLSQQILIRRKKQYLFNIFKTQGHIRKHYKKIDEENIRQSKKQYNVDLTYEGFFLNHRNQNFNINQFCNHIWIELQEIQLSDCNINDDLFQDLCQNWNSYPHLKKLWLYSNKIKNIKQKLIQKILPLQFIDLSNNPLNQPTKAYLRRFRKLNKNIIIRFDD